MTSGNLGIYNSYKREEAMEEVRSTPFSVDEDVELDLSGEKPEPRTFTPEDHQRYAELRKLITEKKKQYKEQENGNTK